MSFLITAGKCLSDFLTEALPNLSSDWWQKLVIEKLTFQQQRTVIDRKINTLSQFDLAATLRILDQNWHELSYKYGFSIEARNWLKEAQNIRNRWAHQPSGGVATEDYLRDLDTIIRLLMILNTPNENVTELKNEKNRLMSQLIQGTNKAEASEEETSSTSFTNRSEGYAAGTLVRLRAQPDIKGAILSVNLSGVENSYQVFMEGGLRQLFESQIESIDALQESVDGISVDDLNAFLSSEQLKNPSLKHLYSLHSSRINFIPYQFRPVLKLIQADRPRMLIADEVGVGKTIEAGLILKELQARGEVNSVLVICPKPLVAEKKWLTELKRFDEDFEHLDGDALRYCLNEMDLDGEWPTRYARAILPYSLMDEKLLLGASEGRRHIKGLVDLDPTPHFDLVIIDEAHHLRNTNTWAYRVAKHFCENAEAVILLSATPVQLEQTDLFTLLNLIRPDLIPDTESFRLMAEPNRFIHQAIACARSNVVDWNKIAKKMLDQALDTQWGADVLRRDPVSQHIYDIVLQEKTTDQDRVEFISKAESLYTFSTLINRTRRRDSGSFTTRNAHTISIDFTPEQALLHEAVIEITSQMLARKHGSQSIRFMISTLRRQLSSSVFGLVPFLEQSLTRQLSELALTEMDDVSTELTMDSSEFKQEIASIVHKAKNLSAIDPKYDALLALIQDKTEHEDNNKLLIFSAFRHTLSYLVTRLAATKVRFALIHGDVSDEDRQRIRYRFSLPKQHADAVDIVFSSEVGCEGLDYQFCDAIVNYDLPWNPMRIEQRIGRIDRYGQKSEAIAIYNFITPGTVDAEIYNRCHSRIGVFTQSIGGNEVILGEISDQIRKIAQDLTLTDAQISAKLKQLSDNEIRLMNEQERLEKEQAQLFGLDASASNEVERAKSFWLEPEQLKNLVNAYFAKIGQSYSIPTHKETATLTIGVDGREKLLQDFKLLDSSHRKGRTAKDWERWLKGSVQHLAVTFSSEVAIADPAIVLLHPMHPLVKQAATALKQKQKHYCHFQVEPGQLDIPKGDYPYAIYAWEILGLKPDFTFRPIVANEVIQSSILSLISHAKTLEGATLTDEQESELSSLHHLVWLDARSQHIEETQQLVDIKLESLQSTHRARVRLIDERILGAENDKIKRMRMGELNNKVSEYERRKDRLIAQGQGAELLTSLVVTGD